LREPFLPVELDRADIGAGFVGKGLLVAAGWGTVFSSPDGTNSTETTPISPRSASTAVGVTVAGIA